MLLSSSIPVNLHSTLSDPSFSDLAEEQRPQPQSREFKDVKSKQPARTESPVYPTCNEGRRANPNPGGLPTRQVSQSTRRWKTKSAPLEGLVLPAVHQDWVGAREQRWKGKERVVEKRRSAPIRKSKPMFEVDELREKDWGESASFPRRRSNASSPRLPTFIYDNLEEGPSTSVLPLSAWRPEERMASIPEDAPEDVKPLRKPSKKVSFSKDPEIITPAPNDSIIAGSAPLRRQSEWTGPFLISTPSPVAHPIATRRTSLPSIRGQAAGPSILRRASSFTGEALPQKRGNVVKVNLESIVEPQSVPRRKPVGMLPTLAPPSAVDPAKPQLKRQISMPSVWHQASGSSILRRTSSFDRIGNGSRQKGLGMERVKSAPTVGLQSIPRCKPIQTVVSLPPTSPLVNSAASSSPSSMMQGQPEKLKEEKAQDAEQIHKQTINIPLKPKRPAPTLSPEQRAIRHWSMHGVGHWVRRSGAFMRGSMISDSVPLVPSFPAEMEKLEFQAGAGNQPWAVEKIGQDRIREVVNIHPLIERSLVPNPPFTYNGKPATSGTFH
ncbi:uncharacterized protein BDR25DRAFT_350842 [Lindgomyces ingoldianus]|uniref:Uncharacterized protein n=1 Tax=Lindgomyces ingoldianus TaxID=673940 RepID=A0ACB6R829_9PLEO|nr:uncharacterized protein BDR25DRAFT_350842 [Lindgomyces ingoldianus]KAF2475474.1 hypothetical protein BDR25DRAFT_350842 [Lindgomyces ingoldianus]